VGLGLADRPSLTSSDGAGATWLVTAAFSLSEGIGESVDPEGIGESVDPLTDGSLATPAPSGTTLFPGVDTLTAGSSAPSGATLFDVREDRGTSLAGGGPVN